MAGLKSHSLEYKAFKPREIINKGTLNHSAENVIKQEYNKPFDLLIEKDSWLSKKREWLYESVPYWKNLSKSYPFSKSNYEKKSKSLFDTVGKWTLLDVGQQS